MLPLSTLLRITERKQEKSGVAVHTVWGRPKGGLLYPEVSIAREVYSSDSTRLSGHLFLSTFFRNYNLYLFLSTSVPSSGPCQNRSIDMFIVDISNTWMID